MAFKPLAEKIQIGYKNEVVPSNILSIASSNITGFITGFPLDNQKFGKDPWLVTKTNGIGAGAPTIEITFSSSKTIRGVGLLNHTLYDAGYTKVYFDYGSWTNAGSIDVKAKNADMFAMLTTGGIGSNTWRIRMDAAHGNFTIGAIFLGFAAELTTNPVDGGLVQTRTPNITIEDSSGGARHVITDSSYSRGSMEVVFDMQTAVDAEILRVLDEGDLIGILPPEYVDDPDSAAPTYDAVQSTPFGQEVFWGYITNRRNATTGVGGTVDGAYKYATVVTLEGI